MAKLKLKKKDKSTIIWEPKRFNKEFGPLFKQDYRLNNQQLKQYAQEVSAIRSSVTERAKL